MGVAGDAERSGAALLFSARVRLAGVLLSCFDMSFSLGLDLAWSKLTLFTFPKL